MKFADGTHPGNERIPDEVSQRDDKSLLVAELLANDTQGWARLLGLMSQLALPSRPEIEIEIGPGMWTSVESLSIERGGELVFGIGRGGQRQEFRFTRAEPIPQWRHGRRSPMVPTASSRRP